MIVCVSRAVYQSARSDVGRGRSGPVSHWQAATSASTAVTAADPYVKGRRDANNRVKDDGAKFKLVRENGKKTGELVFRQAPDYDPNGENVYEFTITAVSGTGDRRETTTVNVTVTVVQAP